MQTLRRAVRAASRASEQENIRVSHNACLDEVDVVLPGREVDVGHWVEGENVGSNAGVLVSVSPFPYSPHTQARPSNQPARPVRRWWTDRPSAAGKPAAEGLSRLLRPAPVDAGPTAGAGYLVEGRRSHAHACRGQPGATPSAQPLRPLRKGPPGSAVAAGNTSPGSARGLLCRFTIGRHWHSEIQDSDGP